MIYYNPEDHGLEILGHIEDENLDYEFHILCVWKCKDVLYWATDSGWSWPSPFEDYYFSGPDNHNLNTGVCALFDAIEEFPATDFAKKQLLGWLNDFQNSLDS